MRLATLRVFLALLALSSGLAHGWIWSKDEPLSITEKCRLRLESARADIAKNKPSAARGTIDEMLSDQFRRMMLAIETCYSGRWGQALEGLPDLVVLTAASPYESSKADLYDNTLGVYLSNAFARTFRRQINDNVDISIYNLYRELVRTTPGSHVSLYNQNEYGSVYEESMNEFFK